jgi:hypothetical protein
MNLFTKDETKAFIKYFAIKYMTDTYFEFNEEVTRKTFERKLNAKLEKLKYVTPIEKWVVACDENNNTQSIIDGNLFVADIYMKFEGDADFEIFNLVATHTGIDMSEIHGNILMPKEE